jgi:hypothetical protein
MKGEFSTLRTELFELTVIPALTPHPVQMYRQLLDEQPSALASPTQGLLATRCLGSILTVSDVSGKESCNEG